MFQLRFYSPNNLIALAIIRVQLSAIALILLPVLTQPAYTAQCPVCKEHAIHTLPKAQDLTVQCDQDMNSCVYT